MIAASKYGQQAMTKSQVSQSWHKPAGALMAWLDSVSVMTSRATKAELSWVKLNCGNTMFGVLKKH